MTRGLESWGYRFGVPMLRVRGNHADVELFGKKLISRLISRGTSFDVPMMNQRHDKALPNPSHPARYSRLYIPFVVPTSDPLNLAPSSKLA